MQGHSTTKRPYGTKVLITCDHCGRSLLRWPSSLSYSKTHFCSTACKKQHIAVSLEERFWIQVTRTDSCWIWTGQKDSKGYGVISTHSNGKHVVKKAHRLSYKFHYGEIPEDAYICHHCDNSSCVNPAHLYAGTAATNAQDCVRRGRYRSPGLLSNQKGEANSRAKLTNETVRNIRKIFAQGNHSYGGLANEFQVPKSTIANIIKRHTWNHI